MSSTTENGKVEYRIRTVTRYIVTRYESADHRYDDGRMSYSGGSESFGEFDNVHAAYRVALGLCKTEHSERGWPQGDGRITYPDHPDSLSAKMNAQDPPAPRQGSSLAEANGRLQGQIVGGSL